MSTSTRQAIETALKEVCDAIEECEDETDGDEQEQYMAAQKYLWGTNRIYSRKIETVMTNITYRHDTLLARHYAKVLKRKGGAEQTVPVQAPVAAPSSNIQHIAPSFSAKEPSWETTINE